MKETSNLYIKTENTSSNPPNPTEKLKYLTEVFDKTNKLNQCIDQIRFIKTFITRFPAKRYYESNDIDILDWINYHFELLFYKLHTINDLMKLVVNTVYQLNLEPRKCTWSSLTNFIDESSEPMQLINKFFKTFENQINARHESSHRGSFQDPGISEIELNFGHLIYRHNKYLSEEDRKDLAKTFPPILIDHKIKELRKERLKFIDNVESIVHEQIRSFYASLHKELETKIHAL